MVKLLIIADDFTGALDTGVQFAIQGACTKIVSGKDAEHLQIGQEQAEVIIVDTETRHLSGEQAYRVVVKLAAKALKENIPYIFKKTDSALRGNIGMELAALLEVSSEKFLPFIPALPALNRVTRKGIHYMDEVPIAETVFGKDPFEPVTSSYIKDLFLHTQIHAEVIKKSTNYHLDFDKPAVGIFDADTIDDIRNIVKDLNNKNKLRIMAGCAGLASVLSEILDFTHHIKEKPKLSRPLLVICGSLNPISKKQIEYAQKQGYSRFTISEEEQLETDYQETEEGKSWLASMKAELKKSKAVMIDTGLSKEIGFKSEDTRKKIASGLGDIVKQLINDSDCKTVMITGGDTLSGFVEQTGCEEITLIGEIKPGTVLSTMLIEGREVSVLSKSGGFGEEHLVSDIIREFILG